jgi:hypothetical protein
MNDLLIKFYLTNDLVRKKVNGAIHVVVLNCLPFKTMFMKKIYILFLPLFIFSCSTQVQYIGKSYKPDGDPEVYVAESEIKKPYSIIGRGYIKVGVPSYGGINWNQVQKKAIKTGWQHGADAVLIVQKNTLNPLPTYQTYGSIDSVGRGLQTFSKTEAYYPVSTWHDILFLKYK